MAAAASMRRKKRTAPDTAESANPISGPSVGATRAPATSSARWSKRNPSPIRMPATSESRKNVSPGETACASPSRYASRSSARSWVSMRRARRRRAAECRSRGS